MIRQAHKNGNRVGGLFEAVEDGELPAPAAQTCLPIVENSAVVVTHIFRPDLGMCQHLRGSMRRNHFVVGAEFAHSQGRPRNGANPGLEDEAASR